MFYGILIVKVEILFPDIRCIVQSFSYIPVMKLGMMMA
jgi:hypothetical protein